MAGGALVVLELMTELHKQYMNRLFLEIASRGVHWNLSWH